MTTYANGYGVEKDSEKYSVTVESNTIRDLRSANRSQRKRFFKCFRRNGNLRDR